MLLLVAVEENAEVRNWKSKVVQVELDLWNWQLNELLLFWLFVSVTTVLSGDNRNKSKESEEDDYLVMWLKIFEFNICGLFVLSYTTKSYYFDSKLTCLFILIGFVLLVLYLRSEKVCLFDCLFKMSLECFDKICPVVLCFYTKKCLWKRASANKSI